VRRPGQDAGRGKGLAPIVLLGVTYASPWSPRPSRRWTSSVQAPCLVMASTRRPTAWWRRQRWPPATSPLTAAGGPGSSSPASPAALNSACGSLVRESGDQARLHRGPVTIVVR